MFFDRYYDRGVGWYSQYFQHKRSDQLRGEVAPTYFDETTVPERIRKVSPDCRILVTLRDPVERAWSLFLHHRKKGRVSKSFWDATQQIPRIIEAGRYAQHIPRWKSTFSPEQVSLLFLNDFRTEPTKTLRSIQRTLGIEIMAPPENRNNSLNDTSMPRFQTLARGASFLAGTLHKYGFHGLVRMAEDAGLKSIVYTGGEKRIPSLSTAIRESLLDEYEQDIAFVEEETKRDLSRWRE